MLSVMRMSELSERSGVPVPSIKFYLREELLAPGEHSSPNQASYGDEHVQRLRLVRALIDVAGLSVAAVRSVLAAIDNTDLPLDWAFGLAQRATPGGVPDHEPEGESRGAREVQQLLAGAGWQISAGNPGRAMSARVLDTYERLGHERLIATLPAYLQAAEIIARADLEAVAAAPDRAAMVETVVIGTTLGDTLLAGLRRIAQERASDDAFPTPPGAIPPPELDDCTDDITDDNTEETTP